MTNPYYRKTFSPAFGSLARSATLKQEFAAVEAGFDAFSGALSGSGGSALVTFLPFGTGAASRTAQSKLRELVSIVDFGADLTGVADSATAYTNAVSTGKLVQIPKGSVKRGATTTVYPTDHFVGVLRIGDQITTNSSDPQVIVARLVDNGAAGNGHCFSDSSTISRGGGISYNSFDGRVAVTGSEDFGHYAAFQSGPTFAGSGSIDNVFSFVASITVDGNDILNNYGQFFSPPTITSGSVRQNWVVYADALPEFTSAPPYYNYMLYNSGAARIYTAGQANHKMVVVSDTEETGQKPLHVISAAGDEAAIRIQQQTFNTWDFRIPASQTYLEVVSGTATAARILTDGKWLLGYTSSNGSYNLQVNSQIFATSATVATSDGRYKQAVQPIQDALPLVMALRPVSFEWIKHPVHNFDVGQRQIGFIAQDVQGAIRAESYAGAIVTGNECELEDGTQEQFLGLSETKLIPLLVRALQQLADRVAALESSTPNR